MSYNVILIAVLVIYLAANLAIGIYAGRKQVSDHPEKGFLSNYFIGGRSMGGLVLAMTTVATFTSASSFLGGPGVAYGRGLVWVYLSVIQVPTAFLILAILGKRFAIVSRRTNAVTITDFLRERYKSNAVVIISSICLLLFFVAQMIAQFRGGAILFEAITGQPYWVGLLLFGIIVILYTTFGGFKSVVITDAIQGIVMLAGAFIILFTVITVAGGFEPMIDKLNVANPGWADITGGGTTTKAYVLSFWVLVGIGVLGLPQTAVRNMGFKDTKSLHSAIIYGTITVTILMLVMHIAGAFAPAVIDASEISSTDYVLPSIVLRYVNPVVAGIFIAAPLAAIMSTVDSLLIMASAAIVKDLYLNFKKGANTGSAETKTPVVSDASEKKLSTFSILSTLIIGLVVLGLTWLLTNNAESLVWINLFGMGGLECAFFCPIVFGLFWKRSNATGAILSAVIGVAAFLILSIKGVTFFGMTAVVPSVLISVAAFIIGSLIGRRPTQETLDVFYN